MAQGYKIIMWDVLSADFDTTLTPEKCLQNVLSNIQPGSVIIFHDSAKAFKNLEYALRNWCVILMVNSPIRSFDKSFIEELKKIFLLKAQGDEEKYIYEVQRSVTLRRLIEGLFI